MKNLWLNPRAKPITLPLSRWKGYPYFLHSMTQYEAFQAPRYVYVTWHPLAPILTDQAPWLDSNNKWEQEQTHTFIRQIKQRIRDNEDVPPIVLLRGELFDGRHRGWAALDLGIERAPVIDITPYWKS